MKFNKSEYFKSMANLTENFRQFKDNVTVFFDAPETTSKSVKVQVARLLNLIDSESMKIYRTNNLDKDKETVDLIFDKLK